jgi:Ribbon-helix-helix protein, copG family
MYYVYGYMKRTTIMLPDDLKERGMRKARRRGISLGELIRESLQAHVDSPDIQPTEDPLYEDDAVFKGKAPRDFAKNHDRYLYGSK